MARAPRVWLGEPDPTDSIEEIRAEDPVLNEIREFFSMRPTYFELDWRYTVARMVEIAEEDAGRPTNLNSPDLKKFLLRVAAERGRSDVISPDRLGRWLRRISGRVVARHRLIKEHDPVRNVAAYRFIEA